jgi:GAF domain-containing protein
VQERTHELAEANAGLTEALEQQTATSEILRVISSSPTDIQPVLDALAQSAVRLCDSFDAIIFRVDTDALRLVAHHGPIPYGSIGEFTIPLGPGSVSGRSIIEHQTIQVTDLQTETEEFPVGAASALQFGYRTTLAVPLLRESAGIGAIALRRTEVRPFTDNQVTLLQTFAAQAVIAIENVRLFKELEARNRDLTESLEQQTATSEILRVISSSPTDVHPVFDTIARNARRLCEADSAALLMYDGELIRLESLDNASPERSDALRQAYPMAATQGHATGRAIRTGQPIHIRDVRQDPEYALGGVRDQDLRSVLSDPCFAMGSRSALLRFTRGRMRDLFPTSKSSC